MELSKKWSQQFNQFSILHQMNKMKMIFFMNLLKYSIKNLKLNQINKTYLQEDLELV